MTGLRIRNTADLRAALCDQRETADATADVWRAVAKGIAEPLFADMLAAGVPADRAESLRDEVTANLARIAAAELAVVRQINVTLDHVTTVVRRTEAARDGARERFVV